MLSSSFVESDTSLQVMLWFFFLFFIFFFYCYFFFFFQAEDGIRDFCLSRGLGDVYKRQVIKLDVKHFYESISFDNLIDKLKTDMLLSARLINILGSLKLLGAKGLPRGLSISPILSEIFMKNVDSAIKNIPGVYYYSPVSYTHLRAHETGRNLVCRLLLEKKKEQNIKKKKTST